MHAGTERRRAFERVEAHELARSKKPNKLCPDVWLLVRSLFVRTSGSMCCRRPRLSRTRRRLPALSVCSNLQRDCWRSQISLHQSSLHCVHVGRCGMESRPGFASSHKSSIHPAHSFILTQVANTESKCHSFGAQTHSNQKRSPRT